MTPASKAQTQILYAYVHKQIFLYIKNKFCTTMREKEKEKEKKKCEISSIKKRNRKNNIIKNLFI